MKNLEIFFALVVAACLMAVASAPAFAVETINWKICKENAGKGQWQNSLCTEAKAGGNWETKEVTETINLTSNAETLELIDTKATGGESRIFCKETDKGWAGREGAGGISAVTFSGCERKTGECEAGTVKATPLTLAWFLSVLRRGSGAGPRIWITFFSTKGNGPGVKVECEVDKILKVTDECSGAMNALGEEVGGTVVSIFEKRPELESPKQECSIGGAESGEIHGRDVSKQENGHGLFF
jgi:hypothetical protein